MSELHEAVIIGGGPAGLTAGIYLKRAGMDAVLVEKGVVGGTVLRTERIENYPGFPKGVAGTELIALMADQAESLGLTIKPFFDVVDVCLKDDGTFIVKSDESVIETGAIIIASGTGWKELGIPGEKEFTGKGVSYCATCDAMFFEDQDVAVIGGGDSAIQEALTLAKLCRHVFVVHRRELLRAQKVIQERATKHPRMQFLWKKVPVEIVGREGQVDSLVLKDIQTGERSDLEVQGVFVFIGLEANTDFLGDLVERDNGGFILTDENLSSKTKGLFVAGDVRKKSLRQITTAVGEGALAAVNLEKYLQEVM